MCGIVGIISAHSNGFTSQEMDAFGAMLFVDTLRGFDSTGVFGVDTSGDVVVHKEASHGPDFMSRKEYRDFKMEMIRDGKVAVGHNRAATRGKVSDENAHPFVVDDKIVLVQNGSYKGDHKHLKDVEVDTHAIAHVISENADVEAALKKVNAAYALVWFNYETKELHIIRNSERPLFICAYGTSGIMFASEASTLRFAADKANLKITDPISVVEHEHHVFTLAKGSYTRKMAKLNCAYPFRHTQTSWQGGHWYNQWAGDDDNTIPVVTPVRLTANNSGNDHRAWGAGGIKETVYQFHHGLFESNAEYLYPSLDAAQEALTAVQEQINNKAFVVELLDYMACNNHPNCQAFYVYGTILNPVEENDSGPAVLVYWMVYDKTENQILDMISNNSFYSVEVSSRAIIPDAMSKKCVVRMFANKQTPIDISTLTV